MSLSRRTKLIAISMSVVVVVAVVAKVLIAMLYPADLRAQLARVLGVNAEVLWINLPPAKNRLPGSAFIYQSTLLAIDAVQSDADDLSTGSDFELDWVSSTGSKLNTSADAGLLGLIYGDSGIFKVALRATKCRSLEVPLNKLKQRLLKSDEIREQAALGREPLVVVRSYEGMVTLRVSKDSKTSAEMWQKAKVAARESASLPHSKMLVQGESDDSLEVVFKEPIVFAYEMVAAKLIATHLGAQPNDVQFTPFPEPRVEQPAKKASEAAAFNDPRHWALATAAVSSFPKTSWLQQDWNRHSADQVNKSLQAFAPTVVENYRTNPDSLSSADRLLAFAGEVGRKARAAGARLLVFYYVGHTVTTSSGEILLLQSGVTPQFLKGLGGQERAPPVGSLIPLQQVLEAAQPMDGEVALRLSELHSVLAESGLPFVILLDGCMENAVVRQTVEGAGFRYDPQHPTLYYIGAEPLTQRLISQVGNSLKNFGARSTYLSSRNPIVFAAKPGTLAMLPEDPLWEGAPPLAPLAGKMRRILAPTVSVPVASIAHLFTRTVDMRQGVGQIELSGSISWSDFSTIERTGKTIVLADKRIPFSDAETAVVKRYEPGIGFLESFYFNTAERLFYLVSQGNDWKVWRWNEGGKRLLASDLRWPMMSGTPDGRVYLHHDGDKTLARVDPSGNIQPIKTGLYVERLAQGQLTGELIVVSEASSIAESVPIYVLQSDALIETDRFRSSGLLSIAPIDSRGFLYTREGSTAIYKRVNGREETLTASLDSPGQLAYVQDTVFCLSRSKTRLYKVTKTETKQAELLRSDGSPLLHTSDYLDGFQATLTGTLLITSGDSIIELAPAKLTWISMPKL